MIGERGVRARSQLPQLQAHSEWWNSWMCFDLNINGVSCLEFYSFHFEIKIKIKKNKIIYQNSNVVFGCHSTSLSAHFYFSLWQPTTARVAAEVFGVRWCAYVVCACFTFCLAHGYFTFSLIRSMAGQLTGRKQIHAATQCVPGQHNNEWTNTYTHTAFLLFWMRRCATHNCTIV